MKILFVIDSLGSGGAQRQIVNLSTEFKKIGIDVCVLYFYPEFNFFSKSLNEQNVKIKVIRKKKGFSFQHIIKIKDFINKEKFTTVISFLNSCNIYCSLAKLISTHKFRLILGERSSYLAEGKLRFKSILLRLFFMNSDFIVANSYDQASFLKQIPFIRKKIKVIYNGYNIPNYKEKKYSAKNQSRFLVIGRIDKNKNPINLFKALYETCKAKDFRYKINVSWVGRIAEDNESKVYFKEVNNYIKNNDLKDKLDWEWLGEVKDVYKLFDDYDALINLSYYEGLPNSICESFINSTPVIASYVCENPALIGNNQRGFLCDPSDINSIAIAIKKFKNLNLKDKKIISVNAYKFALSSFNIKLITENYLELML